jgi:hypothetical protein
MRVLPINVESRKDYAIDRDTSADGNAALDEVLERGVVASG